MNINLGIVSRLDKFTTGLVVISKNKDTTLKLRDLFKNREIDKYYIALINKKDIIKYESFRTIEGYLIRNSNNKKTFKLDKDGKYSKTRYKIIHSRDNYHLVLLKLETGRTHQLRVHLKSIGLPIYQDDLYNTYDSSKDTLFLHSYYLYFSLNDMIYEFDSDIPLKFSNLLELNNEELNTLIIKEIKESK